MERESQPRSSNGGGTFEVKKVEQVPSLTPQLVERYIDKAREIASSDVDAFVIELADNINSAETQYKHGLISTEIRRNPVKVLAGYSVG